MMEPARQNYEYVARKVYDCDQPRGGATMIEVQVVLIARLSVLSSKYPAKSSMMTR